MRFIALASLLALSLPGLLPAQEDDALTGEGEVGASFFFGNTDQTTVNTRASVEWRPELWTFQGGATFGYGEATDDEGASFVSKRSWIVDAGADYTGFGRVSPSLTGRVESSFEKRLDLRAALGAGANFEAVRNDRTRVTVSLAILAEHTRPRALSPEEPEPEGVTVGRWSGRFRFRRALSDGGVIFNSDTSFHPEVATFDSFTFVSENSLAFELTEVLSLKLSFIDSFDSQAQDRGADTNNDGQLIFSLLSTFE